MDPDLPPTYAALASPASPVPLYSERPSIAERVLITEPHSTRLAPAAQGQRHVYKTDYLEVRLHPPHWGLTLPAYGFAGTVDGLIAFRKSCSHVTEVSVSLQGAINTSTVQYATVVVPSLSKVLVLNKKQVVYAAPHNQSSTLNDEHAFAIRFPTHIDDQEDPLPPSYTVYQPGMSTEIRYSFRVDIIRKGFRRHEKLVVPLLYLPKSRPMSPPMEELSWPRTGVLIGSDSISTTMLQPSWLPGQDAAQGQEDLPRISVTMAATKCFASGDMIVILLKIECPRSPVLTKLLSHNAHLSLVKRQKTWIFRGAQISIREQCLSSAELYLADNSHEGVAYLRLEVQAGESGRETSWSVKDSVAVEYVIRLVIPPPEHLKDFPLYKHEVPVTVTTDQYGTLQSELLVLGGVPFPALGLNGTQRHLRSDR